MSGSRALPLAGLLVLLAALAAGCGAGADGEPGLAVYLSAPKGGPGAADARDVADGARLAIADAGSEAAGIPVRLAVLAGAVARYPTARAAANARTATRDSTAIAYIGEVDSGTTRTSLPITNEAGLLQVSAGASAVDLTRAAPGSDLVPDRVQPSGARTFGRVVPSDPDQGAAAAGWMRATGEESVAAIAARGPYGQALVDGLESLSGGPSLASPAAEVDAIYVAADRPEPDILDTGGDPVVYGADAEIVGSPPRTGLPAGSRLVSGPQAPAQLPAPAGELIRRFRSAYDRGPGRFAAYGYEAMAVVLDAIGRADDPTDRGSVIDAFFATGDRDSVLGTYSIDEAGDTTLRRVGAYLSGDDGSLEAAPAALRVP